MTADLECAGIRKEFDGAVALRDVDLTVESGSFFAIVGPSGCGKSTLLRIVGGHERADRGTVRLRGVDVTDEPPERRPVHTVFQHHALFPHLSVRDNVAFPLRMSGVAREERRRRADEALALVRLPGRGDRTVGTLSGGERQRVALARSIVPKPAVLLLDEPLGALDLLLRHAMQDELRVLKRETGITFVHVTHDQEEAFRLADTVAVMRAGEVVQRGVPREVYRRPATPFVAAFLGVSNLIPGTATRDGTFRSRGGLALRTTTARSGDVVAAIREEHLLVHRAGTQEPGSEVGVVEDVVFLGPTTRVVVAIGADRISGHADPTERIEVGDRASIAVDPPDVLLLAPEATS